MLPIASQSFASLLEQTSDDIHVLVRADTGGALQRIREGLQSIAADGVTCPEGWEHRVRLVCGDLSAPNLGLSTAAWCSLAEGVHTIYHNGGGAGGTSGNSASTSLSS